MAHNYADVLATLNAHGLRVDSLQIGRMVRCKVEGDREKRGWYSLHEIQGTSGDLLIVGSYGIWHGNDNGAQKIQLTKNELSREQLESVRRRLAEDRKRADAQRREENRRAAEQAAATWAKCLPNGESDYLARKGVEGYGVRYSKSGALVIPMLDTGGRIHGLQVIRSRDAAKREGAPDKQYWPAGVAVKGHFHLIGSPAWVVLVAEGYATAATLHAATGYPVAVAFDAGNLTPVATALRKRYRGARVLICADDDSLAKCRACTAPVHLTRAPKTCPSCGADHSRSNAGITSASAAALEVSGAWLRPTWSDEDARFAAFAKSGAKPTDFNDLHMAEGLHVVRSQVEARLLEMGWSPRAAVAARTTTTGGEGSDALRPIDSSVELLERYCLVYGQGGTVFDRQEHCLLSLSDMRDACVSKDIHKAWAEHPAREIVRVQEVGFDPGSEDPAITCNLWAGWPTVPKAGRCEKLLDLLRYMCSADQHGEQLYQWVLRWIAYPIQRPGAKMKTTLVIHGPQGTGKNLFFEALMGIYGRYGRVIDQSAIEDRFNDWASRKLFLIADEVVARSDLYHVKNKLKAFITGEWIRINPKNMAAYDERNHVNVVFLSNEAMPVVLEEDDRRHAVIWTPEKLASGFYREVLAEIAQGGGAALHDYLLNVDLGEFGPGTLPPLTQAKSELINLSLDSTSRFIYDLENGQVAGVKAKPCLSTDFYELYRLWCQRNGHRAAPLPRLVNVAARKHSVHTVRKRYVDGSKVSGPHGVVMLGGEQCPEALPEQEWLGINIAAFGVELSDYKGAAHG